MIDTVCLVLDGVHLPRGLDDEKWEFKAFQRGLVYRQSMHLQTWKMHPDLKHVRVDYRQKRGRLSVEVCVPRLIYRSNVGVLTPDDLAEAVKRLDMVIAWGLTEYWGTSLMTLPSAWDWRVRRLDMPFNYKPSSAPFHAALKTLIGLQRAAWQNKDQRNNQTAYFRGKGKRKRVEIAIYDKHAEATKNSPASADFADDLIRLEVRLFDQDTVNRGFKLGRAPTLCDVADVSRINAVIMKRLKQLRIEPGLESIEIEFEELAKRVGRKRAVLLKPFRDALMQMPLADVAAYLGMSMTTARRRMKLLKDCGVFPATVSAAGVIEELLDQLAGRVESREAPDINAPRAAVAAPVGSQHCGTRAVGSTGTEPEVIDDRP